MRNSLWRLQRQLESVRSGLAPAVDDLFRRRAIERVVDLDRGKALRVVRQHLCRGQRLRIEAAFPFGIVVAERAHPHHASTVKHMKTSDLLTSLERFADAWNRHDLDALMALMTDDCVFQASAGPDVDGQRSEGKPAVRAAYAAV